MKKKSAEGEEWQDNDKQPLSFEGTITHVVSAVLNRYSMLLQLFFNQGYFAKF